MHLNTDSYEPLSLQCQQILADMFSIDKEKLSDPASLSEFLQKVAQAGGFTLSEPAITHYQNGYGIFAFFKEINGHISLHANPERNFLALDILLFSRTDIEQLFAIFHKTLNPGMIRKTTLPRGLPA